jgi:hypothetical protein
MMDTALLPLYPLALPKSFAHVGNHIHRGMTLRIYHSLGISNPAMSCKKVTAPCYREWAVKGFAHRLADNNMWEGGCLRYIVYSTQGREA